MMYEILNALTNRPQTRRDLCRKVGISDRKLRKYISLLRREGYPVCSSSQVSGYWLGDQSDRKALAADYRHRAAQMYEIANKLEAGAAKEGQVEFDV